MQVKEIYENALALNIAKPADDVELEFFAVKLFNILLAEAKLYNDSIRTGKSLLPLDKAPTVKSIEDEMPYEAELYAPLSYGLASKLLAAQEETTLASLYHNQYVTLMELATPYVPVEVC